MQTKETLIPIIAGLLLIPVWLQAQGNPVLNEETAADLAAGKFTVAVLDFEGRGISQLEAATLTDRLSSELANTDAIILVERNQMSEILDEQGFQQSGPPIGCGSEIIDVLAGLVGYNQVNKKFFRAWKSNGGRVAP